MGKNAKIAASALLCLLVHCFSELYAQHQPPDGIYSIPLGGNTYITEKKDRESKEKLTEKSSLSQTL